MADILKHLDLTERNSILMRSIRLHLRHLPKYVMTRRVKSLER